MKSRTIIRMVISFAILIVPAILKAENKVMIPSIPWEGKEDIGVPVNLYLEGGFLSTEKGCPDWGTSDPTQIRFVGDRLGDLVVAYSDGKEERVPLVLGYTLWMHGIWMEGPAPFKGSFADDGYAGLLQKTLCLKGAFEGAEKGLLKIRLKRGDIRSIKVEKAKDKDVMPVFTGGWLSSEDMDDDFFSTHTIVAGEGVPSAVKNAMKQFDVALHTFESDFGSAPVPFTADSPIGITFSGSKLAKIANGVVQCNIDNLRERTEDTGFIHTSYKDAPSWRYDGFGPYVMNANSYFDSFYSRDAARAIMTLCGYHETFKAEQACLFGNKWMMYYPEQGLTLGGKPIPGHFSVIPNKPLIYSQILTKIGVPALSDDPDGGAQGAWPTRYTRKRFGDECENLGNQETDGHGLMMMANWMAWKNAGGTAEYVQENWEYISEAAKWIEWCFENPELSFVQDGLLYGETEAAMNTYTLYSNVPCYLGMLCYADMATVAGNTDDARRWVSYAEKIKEGIEKGLVEEDGAKWDSKHFGFFHDPVPTMFADVYGYDLSEIPESWLERSQSTFDSDLEKTVKFGWFGPNGIGYNHSMMTQNALLLDRTEAASKLLESLSKICYAPRLPEPYLVPEGMAIDAAKGVYRRQGDLGNLVQLAEALKCYLIAIGISPVQDGTLKIMPRLPKGWSVDVTDFPVQNTSATISLKVGKPKGNKQSIEWKLSSDEEVSGVEVRFGPFKTNKDKAKVKLNGKRYTIDLVQNGDASWGWVRVK